MNFSSNLGGIALMTGGMASATAADATLKYVTQDHSPAQVLTMSAIYGSIVTALWLVSRGEALVTRLATRPTILLRTAGEVVGGYAVALALSHAPLSFFTAVFQSVPILVTLGAVLFLGEKVGLRRWLAIGTGLVGVLVIVRPEGGGTALGVAFSLLCAVALATRDLMSRAVPREASIGQLAFWAYLGLLGTGVVILVGSGTPLPLDPRFIGLTALFAFWMGAAIVLITASMRAGEVSVVAPFRYTRLIFAFLAAMVLYGERPDIWTWVGALIVVGSGLFIFRRQARAG